jgi:hypothetical protein
MSFIFFIIFINIMFTSDILTKNQPARQMSDGQTSYLMPYRLSTVLASNVTAAIRVNALPCNVAPVVSVID